MDSQIYRRSYDRFADRYDEVFMLQQVPKILRLAAELPDPTPTPALDLGCGTGLVTRTTLIPCVGVDISRRMLRAGPRGPRVQADLARLPFPDAAFGLAFAITALIDFTPDLPGVFEMARVLRPGGLLALSVLKRENLPALASALARAGFDVQRRLDVSNDVGFVCRRAVAP